MTPLESIVLGAIQGITEFLPISSSAHLIILPWFFKIEHNGVNPLTFDVMLHFGTLIAILAVYGKRFFFIMLDGLRELKQRRIKESLFLKIVVGTLPAVILGLFFKDFIEEYLRTPYVTVFTLIVVSILMIISERIFVSDRPLSYMVALLIGIAQAMALIPGTSRSGITITAGLLLGLRRKEAVDFSFLLSIPIIAGTALYESRHIDYLNTKGIELYAYGVLSSFLFGILSLKFLIQFLKKHSLDVFAVYRIVLALIILFFS
ncbi:MAG: undecaprenyl-diphosphate phosphatase [Syntrophorhabdaceae bacterium]|nr:undecaprenyl-diphosphate phosphatase [Syntrophorhabdaceae bacterium]